MNSTRSRSRYHKGVDNLMTKLNEVSSGAELYGMTQRRAQSTSSKIVPLRTDTGLYAAIQRAAHQLLDSPKIFEDPLALRIIGADAESKLRSGLAQFQKSTERELRALMAVRNR